MASEVDVTLPADDEKVSKADFRDQFRVIRDEISALQAQIATPGLSAYGNFVSPQEMSRQIRVKARNLAQDMAFGRVSFNPANN